MVQLMSLQDSIVQSARCIDLMIANHLEGAIDLAGRYADRSLYHSHCHSLLLFFKAYLNLERVSRGIWIYFFG